VKKSANPSLGEAVLRYLETPDGTRLLTPDPTGARQLQKIFSGFGGLFGGGGNNGDGGGGGGGGGGGNGAAPPPELPREAFLAQLSSIAWVPVAVDAPAKEPGLPWPARATAVAPPKTVRPPGGAVQVERSCPIARKCPVSTLAPTK
jgi:sacsin